MPLIYSPAIQAARLRVVAEALAGGALELGTAGMGRVLATLPLAVPAGRMAGGELILHLPPEGVQCAAEGEAAAARFRDRTGGVVGYGLTVGLAPTPEQIMRGERPPDVILSFTRLAPGIIVSAENLVLRQET